MSLDRSIMDAELRRMEENLERMMVLRREEVRKDMEARNNIVRFADNSQRENGIFGFGIDINQGIPIATRLIWYRRSSDSSEQSTVLLNEANPLVVIQKINYAMFLKHAQRIFVLAREYHLPEELTCWTVAFYLSSKVFNEIDVINEMIRNLRPHISFEDLIQ